MSRSKARKEQHTSEEEPAGVSGGSIALQVNSVVASMIAIYTATHSLTLTALTEGVVLVAIVTYFVTRPEYEPEPREEETATTQTGPADADATARERTATDHTSTDHAAGNGPEQMDSDDIS